MRCLIVDDEEPARARLTRMLAKHPEVTIAGEARDGVEAVSKIEALHPDLLFLDVELPGMRGFEVLKNLSGAVPEPMTVFVTGYDEHALAAFEANALAYLLKPVEAARLAQAVERAGRLLASVGERRRESDSIARVASEAPAVLRQIVCRKLDRLVLIPPEQIFWFQVEDGVVKAHTGAETYWVNYPIGELEVSLPGGVFFRARREVLVNLAKIREIRPYFKSGFLLVMADAAATEIAISERQARAFRQRVPGL